MARYRYTQTNKWIDDIHMSMSCEQQHLFSFLTTNPWISQCGFMQANFKMMGLCTALGNEKQARSAFDGFCLSYPTFAGYDEEFNEIAVINWPRINLLKASRSTMKQVVKDLEEVMSMTLLKAIIEANSASLSKPYLSRLRSLNMQEINVQMHSSCTPSLTCSKPLKINDVPPNYNYNYNNNKYSANSEDFAQSFFDEQNNGKPIFAMSQNDTPSFEDFWAKYKHHKNKKRAESSWKRLSKKKKLEAIAGIESYDAHLNATPWKSKMLASTYLNGERWNDQHPIEAKSPNGENGFRLMNDGTLKAI